MHCHHRAPHASALCGTKRVTNSSCEAILQIARNSAKTSRLSALGPSPRSDGALFQ
jgi:hypothetical protein